MFVNSFIVNISLQRAQDPLRKQKLTQLEIQILGFTELIPFNLPEKKEGIVS